MLVVGSGPGALQFSHELDQLGIGRATISADPSPGGMFRRLPLFQRLLSWTKPYALGDPASRVGEWISSSNRGTVIGTRRSGCRA